MRGVGAWTCIAKQTKRGNLSNGIEREEDLFNEFIDGGGPGFVKSVFHEAQHPQLLEDWKTLFEMQHYGIPTRLLDWSDKLFYALGFALLDRKKTSTEAAALFLLDPAALNRKSNHKREKIEIGSKSNYHYKELYWYGNPILPEKPVALETPRDYWNERMAAQRGRFTVHGTDRRAIEDQFPDIVVKVTIPPEAVEDIKETLREADITAVKLYPDIAGLALHIRTLYFGDLPSE